MFVGEQGVNRARFEQIRTEIIQCLALVEALIDFGDGEDIDDGVYEQGKHTYLTDNEYPNTEVKIEQPENESTYCTIRSASIYMTVGEERSCAQGSVWPSSARPTRGRAVCSTFSVCHHHERTMRL